ncbi:MAG: hypothetical protein WEA61_04110 [Anaerolineales bacterium]
MLKKKQTRLATLTAILILGLVLVACSAAPSPTPTNRPAPTNTVAPTSTSTSAPADALNSPLVGIWEGTEVDLGDVIIEFKSDGVYEITDSSGTYLATYEMVDADTFNLIDPSGLSATVDFVRSGDTLSMTMIIDGSTLELHLVP